MRLPLSRHPDQPVIRPKMRMSRRETAQQKFDAMWSECSAQFDPQATISGLKRFEFESRLLSTLDCKRAVDLAAGYGLHTKMLHERGIHVDAVDIAEAPLNRMDFLPSTQRIQAYIPYTPLQDGDYDLVLALDLLAHIPQDEQRLCVSEIARLCAPNGTIILSTDLDIYTDDALSKFLYLTGTELAIDQVHLFHNGLAVRLIDFFHFAPNLQKWLSKREKMADYLEKIAQFYQTESDASGVVVVGRKKKVPEISQSTLPRP